MKYYIYGAGKNAVEVISQLRMYIEIMNIIDNDEKKIGSKIEGIEVIAAKDFITNIASSSNDKIIISVTHPIYKEEIEKDLIEKGLKKNVDFFAAKNICRFAYTPTPGMVSGYIQVPDGFEARKSFDPSSYLVKDYSSNKIYRVIKEGYRQKFEYIYSACKDYNLFGEYVINTRIADDMKILGQGLILEHEYVNTISYCYEWAPHMYEDYVYFMLDFIHTLTNAGLCLCDAHGLNATLNKGHFVFIDFGALDKGFTDSLRIQEILNTLLLPLILMKKNQIKRAYFYLSDHNLLLGISDVAGYLDSTELKELKELYESTIYTNSYLDVVEIIDKIRNYISEFRVAPTIGVWEDYQDSEWHKSDDKNKWSVKMKNAIELIEMAKPKSIIDLAGNQGWYSTYLRSNMDRVIVADMDCTALDKLWDRVKNNKMTNVTPLYMSICAPSLARHYDGFIDGNTIKAIRKSANERFKSDMAIALAIVHHLAFRELLTFDEIIVLLASYTDDYLIVEFVEQTDRFIHDFIKVGYEWYTKENFEKALKELFTVISMKESAPKETRTLYLCKKCR